MESMELMEVPYEDLELHERMALISWGTDMGEEARGWKSLEDNVEIVSLIEKLWRDDGVQRVCREVLEDEDPDGANTVQ